MDRGGCWLITVYRAATNWAIKLRSGGVAGRPSHFQTSILVYLKVSETNDLWQNQAFYICRGWGYTSVLIEKEFLWQMDVTFHIVVPLPWKNRVAHPMDGNSVMKLVKFLVFVLVLIFVFDEDDGQRAVCHRWPEARPDAGWPLQTPYQTSQPLLHFIASSSPSMPLSSLAIAIASGRLDIGLIDGP